MKFQPVIKWSGSKRSQSEEIINRIPNKEYDTYYEPFCEGYSVTHFNFLNYIINGEYTEVKTIKMNQIEYNVFKTIKDCGFLSCKGCALERYCSEIENNFKYKFGYTIGEIDENEIIIEVIEEEIE